MSRLCGGTHEISGIKAPPFLRGGWLEGTWGWVVVGYVMGWVGGCWWVGSWGGLVHGGGVGHGVGGWVVVGWVGVVGGWGGGVVGPHDTPHHGGHQMPPMLFFFDNLVKK